MAGLLLGVDDLAVVDDDGVTGRAGTQGPADGLAESRFVVGCEDLLLFFLHHLEEKRKGGRVGDKTYERLILDTVGLAPCGHDERVVEGDADDEVGALGLQLAELREVAGDMGVLAGRGEGAGDGEEDDLLVLEFCVDVVV